MKLDLEQYQMVNSKQVKVHGVFKNRELTWLEFNHRVLESAFRKSNGFNERFNFLGITENNLDEFMSVRFAKVLEEPTLAPYEKLLEKITKFKEEQNDVFTHILSHLRNKYGMEIYQVNKLGKKEKEKLYDVFQSAIFPLLIPIDISINKPVLQSGLQYIAVLLKKANYESVTIIPIPKEIDPFIQIGDKIILVEDVIRYFMRESIFINQEIIGSGGFKVIKNNSYILDHHDEDRFVIDRMSDTIIQRMNSKPIVLEYWDKSDKDVIDTIENMYSIPEDHVFKNKYTSDLKIWSRFKLDNPKESYEPFEPFVYEKAGNYYDIFEAIKKEDILLHHPYDSYETVVKFVQHAARDKHVRTIRQTLYRVSSIDSPIVNALCEAARNGKSVVVMVEIKARFDEENNLAIVDKLKQSGVIVILGDEYLKTHCKMCLVTREEKGKLKIYSHVGTGNYNEKTAKIYTDLSYLTSKTKVGRDLLMIFNILSGQSKPDEKLEKVFYAPVNLRKKLIKLIDNEISFAKKGKKAEIFIKCNSISDEIMVDKLYEAAKAGVKINIICRGICSIVAVKNIKIKSIIGRFLEHSRLYYFKNGKNHEYYISSADLLTRNLDRRIELLINLKDSSTVKQIEWMMDVFKADEANSWLQSEKGELFKVKGDFDSHQWMIDYSDVKKSKKKWR
jgi:polyphosphate kinase